MSGEFVDTNILVYVHDATSIEKHGVARDLVTRLWDSGDGILSVQVLQEFFWTVTRKIPKPLPIRVAVDILEDLVTWKVYVPTPDDVIRAAELSVRFRIAFWDALIVHAAIASSATVLWTEDLKDGADYGGVRIQNPFTQRE